MKFIDLIGLSRDIGCFSAAVFITLSVFAGPLLAWLEIVEVGIVYILAGVFVWTGMFYMVLISYIFLRRQLLHEMELTGAGPGPGPEPGPKREPEPESGAEADRRG